MKLTELDKDLQTLTETSLGRRSFLALSATLLTACATTGSSNRHREGSNKGQKTALTVKDEEKMTKEYLPQMRKEYPALKDPMLQKYLNELGQKIVSANKLHKKPYEYNFTLTNVQQVNAFALPAGTVFVTVPLLAMAETESELAGVIGHEIGHIQARHTAERMDKAKEEQSKSLLYAVGGAVAGGALGLGLAQLVCRPKDRECVERITKYGAMAGGAGGLLIQKYSFMANSREDEMEADRIGFKTSIAAGFSKDHVGNFYSKLLEMEKQHSKGQNKMLASLADAMSTHPPSKERVVQMNEMANKEKYNPKSVISSDNFYEAKDRLKSYLKKS
jgi:predicted Zn-dependent protease